MTQAKNARASKAEAASESTSTSEIFLEFLKRHKRSFESHLTRRLRSAEKRFPRVGAPTLDTTRVLVDLCQRGGKRVRPGLVLVGATTITDRPKMPVLLDAATALELLHAYFLVHDDWMDRDLVRRGGPSAHAVLRRRFGDDHLGDAAAIMAGDWGVAVATEWMAQLPVEGAKLQAALTCFAHMQLAAVIGQIRDLVSADDDAEFTYRLKTASYTVEGPLLLGAILSGASPAQLKSLTNFALPLGVAFQLRDDLIGVFAPPEQTGKPYASDVRSGKRTALVLEAIRRASPKERRFLLQQLGNSNAREGDLRRFVDLLESLGAHAAVERRIQTLHRRSLKCLQGSRLRAEGKTLLTSAASALIHRGA